MWCDVTAYAGYRMRLSANLARVRVLDVNFRPRP